MAGALLAGPGEDSLIGQVCGDGCSQSTLFGVRLEWHGIALMLAGLAAFGVGLARNGRRALHAGVWLLLMHSGASLAFAASQWIGAAPLCPLCQGATLCSVLAAAFAVASVVKLREAPGWSSAAAPFAGMFFVLVVWSMIDSGKPPEEVAETAAPPPTVEAPAPVAATAPAADSRLQAALDALTLGSPEAAYELILLGDFRCPVCTRFDTRALPALLEGPVADGLLRVRFIFSASHSTQMELAMALTAATTASLAGADPLAAIAAIRAEPRIASVPQLLKRHEDAGLDTGTRLQQYALNPGWQNVVSEHQRLSAALRGKYFEGKRGTPAFVMLRGRLDADLLPDPADCYTFYGYQIADPFLEFMGIAPEPR